MKRYSALKESVAAIKEMKEEAIARENKSKLEESAEMDRIRYERESVLEDRRSRERLLGEYTNKVVNEIGAKFTVERRTIIVKEIGENQEVFTLDERRSKSLHLFVEHASLN